MVDRSKPSPYQQIFERKVQEVFDFLEIDPKKSLRLITKEIESRGKKVLVNELMMLTIVKAFVTERNMRLTEAKADIFGVFDEMEKSNITDRYVHDTLMRTVSQMSGRAEYMQRYLEVIEKLQVNNPKDKELVKSVFDGSVGNNKFDKAAKMAAKLLNNFNEPSYALT